MGEDLGRFALNEQKPQTTDMMETDVMTGQEFKQMVERMRPRLMQMGREFFGSDTEAEEVVQETWLRAWNVRERVTLTDAYVMRIARNCCVSMWRGQRAEVELADESGAAVTEVTPQEELEERENSEWLASRLQRLPKAEREVWQLFYDEGLTVEEIAEARNISVATVRNTISSVRNTLRTALRRRFFTPRQLMSIIIFTLALVLAVASALNPNGVVRGAIERVCGIPVDNTIYDSPEEVASYPWRHGNLLDFPHEEPALSRGCRGRQHSRSGHRSIRCRERRQSDQLRNTSLARRPSHRRSTARPAHDATLAACEKQRPSGA